MGNPKKQLWLGASQCSQRTQDPLIKEYASDHNMKAPKMKVYSLIIKEYTFIFEASNIMI